MLILLKVYKNLISFKLLIAALQREEGKVILCLIELFKNLPPFVLDSTLKSMVAFQNLSKIICL